MSSSFSRAFAHLFSRNVILARSSCWVAALLGAVAISQHELTAAQPSKEVAAEKSVDEEWQEIKNLGPKNFSGATGNGKLTAEQARREFAQELVRDAEQLEKFQAKHPDHAAAKEAKRREALTLLQAWQAGDESREPRRKQLVADLRKDLSLPARQRSEVAAFSENIGVEKRANLSPAARLAAYEEVARALVVEFPDLPDAYEALVQIAKDSPDERAPQIVKDVLAWERTPAAIKKEARAIADRYSLLGKNIAEPTRLVFAQNNPFSNALGSRLVVYTWSSQHAPSIARAKELAAQLPAQTKLIGVCLDQRDLAPAKARAQAEALPGEQIYDWLGRRGEVAEALGAVDPGLIYLVDAKGVIRSVSAQRDLTAALAQLPAQ